MSKLKIKRVLNRGHVQELRASLKHHEATLRELREAVVNAPAIAFKRALEEVGRIDMPKSERELFARRKADTQVKGVRKAARERADAIKKDLAGARELLALSKDALSNPFAVLDSQTLGDTRRATYMANLVGAGPLALKHAAEQAAATNDAALAAAVISVLERMPTADRPFFPQSVLEIFPDDHEVFQPMHEYLDAERALEDSVSLFSEVINGSATTTGKISRGLRTQDAPESEGGEA